MTHKNTPMQLRGDFTEDLSKTLCQLTFCKSASTNTTRQGLYSFSDGPEVAFVFSVADNRVERHQQMSTRLNE
jgi:hypothetical protein